MTGHLRALATELGIEPGYHDVRGAWHEPDDEALLALVAALGWPVARPDDAAEALAELAHRRDQRVLEPVLLAPRGAEALDLGAAADEVALVLEDGTAVEVRHGRGDRFVALPGDLPIGYHRVEVVAGGRDGRALVIVHPPQVRSLAAGTRSWGVFAPLHGLAAEPRYRHLDDLGRWIAGLGGEVVGTLPLLPTFPWDPSPYQPVSRRFWSDRFAEGVPAAPAPGEPAGPGPRSALATWGLTGDRWREVIEWAATRPDAVDLARFRARAALAGGGWRHPSFDPSLDDHVLGQQGGAGAFLVAQHAADTQVAATAANLAARGQRLYLDLPLGCHPDGFDTWDAPELYASGASAGAPPDEFFSGGQNWGFPPVLPEASRHEGHLHLRDDLAHHMAAAGMLRIDHVMQLHRLFWIPEGFDGSHGAYVRAPRDELFAVLAVESTRHDCVVVGEDLGTVPDAVREAMAGHDMSGMWVAEFSVEPWAGAELQLPGRRQVASVDTHDTPTLAGWWGGRDLDVLDALGLLDHAAAEVGRVDRRQQVDNLLGWLEARGHLAPADRGAPRAIHAALLEAMAGSDAELVLVTLEDLWGETEPQNVPGTPADRPNWVQRLRVSIDDLPGYEEGVAVLRRLDSARRDAAGARLRRHDDHLPGPDPADDVGE